MTATVRSLTASPTHQRAVLLIILISYLMIVLDIAIVITALPKIEHSLHFSAANLAWVQSAYTLTFGGLLLLGALAGDILGRKRMFMIGLAIFTMASLMIGLAQSAVWLLAARAVQGVGAAILAPSTLALLSTHFDEGEARTRAVGYYGATAGIGARIGLVVGGLLADSLSWRVGFFMNLPIGMALLYGAQRYLHESERHIGQFDLLGAISSTLGMGALVYGIVRAAQAGWGDVGTLGSLAAGAVLLLFLLWHEWRASQPIMPLRLFASRSRNGAYAARLLFLGAMMGFWFFTTQFLQGVLGISAFAAGLAFLPTTLFNFAAALLVPRLTQRFGNGRLLLGGFSLALLGMIWLSRVSADSSYLMAVVLPMILIGVGQGLSLSPLTIAGIADVEARDAGAASGLVNVAHQLGSSLGLGILIVVFSTAGVGIVDERALLAGRVSAALSASAIMLGAALILAYTLIVRRAR